jgi:alkylhydroperoxidase family enzyme
MAGQAVDLAAVTEKAAGDAGIRHGARLLAFTDAAMGEDDALLGRERQALRAVVSPEAFVDACALVGAFNVVDRIADATGIPLDPMLQAGSADVRAELGLARFGSAANTPGVA